MTQLLPFCGPPVGLLLYTYVLAPAPMSSVLRIEAPHFAPPAWPNYIYKINREGRIHAHGSRMLTGKDAERRLEDSESEPKSSHLLKPDYIVTMFIAPTLD